MIAAARTFIAVLIAICLFSGGVLLIVGVGGCSGMMTKEQPRHIECSAKCSECKNVELRCDGTSKSTETDKMDVSGT
jgi:hypothetical protein